MRARLTLIPVIVAVVISLAPGTAHAQTKVHTAPRSGRAWVTAASIGIAHQVELVDRFRAAQRAKLAALAKALATPPPPPATDPASFIWPARAPITSQFGRRWGRAHTGVDIDAAAGAPIVAAQAGTVTLAGWKHGYGNTVIIDHGDGLSTLYAHQARLAVRTGQQVGQGTLLGTVGSTGNVTAPHLHYEVHVKGVPRDPRPWLR